ncbi:replication protein A 70 kDa DNA-binding subunit D-like [Forsythia ovata]|uniref:Replication protein A 70 kDa DNA-binding subunit D-like n=1 Tax=Forsythia ovata TaxID=205694 RepID=A0ABD1NWT6_9LAMI
MQEVGITIFGLRELLRQRRGQSKFLCSVSQLDSKPKLMDQMEFCVDHLEDNNKLAKMRPQVHKSKLEFCGSSRGQQQACKDETSEASFPLGKDATGARSYFGKIIGQYPTQSSALTQTYTRTQFTIAENNTNTIRQINSSKQTFFWVKATATVTRNREPLWYMACQNCNRQSNGDYGETYFCLFCKYPQARAVPRARASVKLQDETGILHASIIGSPAELFLAYSANQLMENQSTHKTVEQIQHDGINKTGTSIDENPMEKEILGESSNNNSNVQVKRELADASRNQSTKKRANQPNISQIEDKVNQMNKEDITVTQNDNLSTDTANETYESDETPLDSDYASF